MSKSSDRAGERGREEPAAKRRRADGDRESAAAGGDKEKQQKKLVKRYLDYLPEVLIEHALSYVGVRDLEVARHASKMVNVVARRFLPLWIGVAPLTAGDNDDGSAAGVMPAHIKPTLAEALAARPPHCRHHCPPRPTARHQSKAARTASPPR